MKIGLITTVAFVVLQACSANETSAEKLKEKFAAEICENHPILKKDAQLLFIINKPECSPCIAAIEEIVAARYAAGKSAICFGTQPIILPSDIKVLREKENNIAKYGMLGVDGTICLFNDGELLLSVPFDTKAPGKSIEKIRQQLNSPPRRNSLSFRASH